MITVAGEALIDVLIDPSGQISAHPGGAPFNVARTVAALGQPCQFLGRVGGDVFGRRLRAALQERGVTLAVPEPTRAPTTLAVAELDADGVADYRFYLEGTSAGCIGAPDLPPEVLAESQAVAFGGLGLLTEPLSSTLRELLPSVPAAGTVLLDPNCRPHAIDDLESFRATVDGFLAHSDVVKVSVDDLALLDAHHDPRAAARRYLDFRPASVLVTDGGRPVTVHTLGGEQAVPVPSVDLVDTVGAGDAFVAGFLTWWVEQGCTREQAGDLERVTEAARAAVTVAAAACTTAGANLPGAFTWPPPPELVRG
ncbi:MAG TPA: carbohydrate kinase [Solirubrobacteraceae bacterium]|nr:carbohydrate kinase [Solirubrobacteraceae bacterium]